MYLPKPNTWEQQITTKVFHTSYIAHFEIEVRGEKALIIVREYDWHEYTLHSLSEGGELYKQYKKERIAKDASSGNYNPVLNI